MGYVVAARHLQLDQMVAMKFLKKDSANLDQTEATGRFLREAKAVVKLRDEHIARVFDVGTLDGGEPYIVMEYLDGCDLSALSKQRGAIPVPEAVDYVMQACEALAEAHSLGIVHRDVKLANLFVTRGHAGAPLVKVLDFGISKTNPFGESDHEMTRTASMLGSPRFMSPEQMRDPRTVDARSDLWSLGVVLYRLTSGKAPFEADTLGRLLTMVMHESPDPLSAVRGDLPPGFSETVGRCLEKEPSHRYANVAELAYALVPYAADPARARNVADRIAATLSVAQLPRTLDIPPPMPSRPSGPPGANDTGTAAPWTGTHGARLRRDQARNNMIWAAIALGGVIVAGSVFAKVRHDRTVALEAAAAAPLVEAPAAPAVVADNPTMPSLVVPPSLPAEATSARAVPLATGAPAATAAPGTKTAAGSRGRGTLPGSARKTAAPDASASAAKTPRAGKADDGIPSTRD